MNLPQGWIEIRIGDMAQYINGKAFKPSEWEDSGLPIVRIQNLNDDNAKYNFSTEKIEDKYKIKNGDLLFAWSASLGAYIWYGKDAWLNQHIFKVIPYNGVDKKFLYYVLVNTASLFYSKTHGSGMVHITKEPFESTKAILPPLPEQRRIVAKIDSLFSELDNGVTLLKTIKAQLTVYRQAVLKWAFEGKLTEEWRRQNPVNVSTNIEGVPVFLTNDLLSLPEKWFYVFLSKLGDLSRGKSKHRPRNDPRLFENGKYPFIQTGDVKAAKKYIKTYTTQYGEFGLKQSRLWKTGTLCITIAANIAETAFLAIDACFPDSIVGFTADTNVVKSKYVDYFIQSAKLKLWAFAPATAQKNINLETLENLIIPYCPQPEQLAIVSAIESRLSVCDKLEQTIDQTLALSTSLRQSILKKAFEGRLVPPACPVCPTGRRQAGKTPDTLPSPEKNAWYVYVIECNNGSFYKGFTNNLPLRWKQHCEGTASDWTRKHKPVQVYYWEKQNSKNAAIKREEYLKSGSGREWFKEYVVNRPEDWEPAEKLLERIRAEKAAVSAKPVCPTGRQKQTRKRSGK